MGLRTAFWVLAATALLAAAVACLAGEADSSPLTLQQAVSTALARDALVRGAQQSLEDARAALVRARAHTPWLSVGTNTSAASSAGLDPESAVTGTEYSSQSHRSSIAVPLGGGLNVSLSSSASTSTTNSQLRTGGGEEFTYAGVSAGASVSRPLGLFRDERVLTEGGRWSAELSVRGTELALSEARRGVVGDTFTYFFGALRAQRQREIAAASQREAGELLRIAEAKFRRGKLAEIEVMEARVSAETARVALRSAESSAETALDRLKNYLGLELEQTLTLIHQEEATPSTPDDVEESTLLERALAQRADLQQLGLAIHRTELSVRQVEAQSRPGTFLTGGYSRTGQGETIGSAIDQLVNPSWYVGLSFTTSLSGAEDRAAVEQARGALRLLQLDEELRQEEVRLEIRRLLREVQLAAGNSAILAQTAALAEENLRIRQVQFEHGISRPIDVAQTERQLRESRIQHLNAIIDYELARARLRLAAGEMPELKGADQ